ADVLFGDVSPSGKLAETFPVKEEDCPVKISEDEWAEYKESIFTGYRYYSTLNIKPLFCFGHGLSYAEFEYSDLSYKDGAVYLNVKNKSPMRAKETVELYVSKKDKSFLNPATELKGFFKADIPANGTVRVKIELDERAFAFYNTLEKRWCVKSGEYEIKIGSSSEDIRLSTTVTVEGEDAFKLPDYYNLEDLKTFPFYKIYPLPEKKEKEQKADRHTRLYEIKDTFIGGLFCKIAAGVIEAADDQQAMVMRKAALDIPLGSMFNMSPVKIPMSLRKIIIFIADRQLKRLKKKNKIF
ncbi:MAG: fibronectin type III-like domain-contianing protein, partial [Christensenellaceae bacterium]|nr:fibronectin type III-like domain-contianing protein [Christensenellaceae bacterium]